MERVKNKEKSGVLNRVFHNHRGWWKMALIDKNRLFGQIALKLGLVTEADRDEALSRQSDDFSNGINKHIGIYFFEKNLLNKEQIQKILEYQKKLINSHLQNSDPANSVIPVAPSALKESGGLNAQTDNTFIEPKNNLKNLLNSSEGNDKSLSMTKRIKIGERMLILETRIDTASSEADIYLVSEEGDPQKYVLKYYRPQMEPNEKIVQTIKSLPESCSIKIFETGRSESGRFYEIQEYAPSGSFQEYIKKRGPFSEEFIKDFVILLSECVSELHSRNVIHRDIKPANILVRKEEPFEMVLTDFGISSLAVSQLHHTSLSRTIAYSSPESMTGIISAASDYWAIGLIALELLIGRNPFGGMDDKAIMFTIATKTVPELEKIKGGFMPLLKGLLTRDPEKRWGRVQVSAWHSGETGIPVYFEDNAAPKEQAVITQRKYRPYKIGGKEHHELTGLLLALAQNWPQAARDYEEGRLREWLLKEARDNKAIELIKIIENEAGTAKASVDEKLFEFLLRANPEMNFIFKGFHINKNFLIQTAEKIAKVSASPSEKSTLAILINKKIIAKFYEINGDPEFYETEYKAMCEECLKFKNVEDFARVIILHFSEQDRLNAVAEIENIFENYILVKPLAGFQDISHTIAAARRIYKEKRYTLAELVKFLDIDRSTYKTKEEFYRYKFDEYYLEVSEKCSLLLEDRYSPSLMMKFNSSSLIDWKFLRMLDGKIKGHDFYSRDNFAKIIELGSVILFIELREEVDKILKEPVLFDISRKFLDKGFDDKLIDKTTEEIMNDCDEEYYLKLCRLKSSVKGIYEYIGKSKAEVEERLRTELSSEPPPNATINFGNSMAASERVQPQAQKAHFFQTAQINQNSQPAESSNRNQNHTQPNYPQNYYAYSRAWHRVGAYIIDVLIYLFFVLIFFLVAALFHPYGYDPYYLRNFSNFIKFQIYSNIIANAIYFIHFYYCETFPDKMATPGKKIFGLIVIEENKETPVMSSKAFWIRNLIKNPSWISVIFWMMVWTAHSTENMVLLRNLKEISDSSGILIGIFGLVSIVIFLSRNDRKTLHDLIAGTVVVYGRPEDFTNKK